MANDYSGIERRGRKPLTVKQVAAVLGFSQQTVTKWLRDGLLPGWQVKRTWRIDAVAFRKLKTLMEQGINPFVRQNPPDTDIASRHASTRDASTSASLKTGAPDSFHTRERRGLRPITVEWAARVLRRTPEEVMAFADRLPMCAYKNQKGELVFSPSRFRAFYPQLVNAS